MGGAVLALVQHVGLGHVVDPALLRWAFLYALVGGVLAGIWDVLSRQVVVRLRLSRWEAALASGLAAGVLFFGATLLVAALGKDGGTGARLLLGLPWADGLQAFLGGTIGGGVVRWMLH